MKSNPAMHGSGDEPDVIVKGKSRMWMIGLLFFLIIVASFVILVVVIYFYNLWVLISIFGIAIVFSFLLMFIPCFYDKESTVKYDPNSETLTVTVIKSTYLRFCRNQKEIKRIFNIKEINYIGSTSSCCLNKFFATSVNTSICTDPLFKDGQLDPIIKTIRPIVFAQNAERNRLREIELHPPPQQQNVIIVVQNADEYIRQNPNAQIQVINNGSYNPPITLPQQLQQQNQFTQQYQPDSFPADQPSYGLAPTIPPVYSSIASAPPQDSQLTKS
ncbi:MAG: hypothetical protein EZS28_018158 [Streblomastix strix]|uniref:Uncharacterized protein n=1 Tax=Streblomastix strix TaxID=222440 RepID=A0A5J4VV01_9EUKA|nr:MAG: hypothetical protein EZS28_018157 [Streblomastix strix]KAA6386316.1 MAG: hypothetical protein EZS28_018158 [Streblomastix strix]